MNATDIESLTAFFENLKGAPPPTVDFNGTWKNQLGSTMNVAVIGNIVTGTYKSKIGATGGLTDFDLIGSASSDIIAFIVNWSAVATHNSITAWVGQLTKENGREVIKTLWHLTTDVQDDQQEDELLWGSVRAGADTFWRP